MGWANEARVVGGVLAGMALMGGVVACNRSSNGAHTVDTDDTRAMVRSAAYAYDPSSGVCFAAYSPPDLGARLTGVPCTPKLKQKLGISEGDAGTTAAAVVASTQNGVD